MTEQGHVTTPVGSDPYRTVTTRRDERGRSGVIVTHRTAPPLPG
jgi:hypothetical protein